MWKGIQPAELTEWETGCRPCCFNFANWPSCRPVLCIQAKPCDSKPRFLWDWPSVMTPWNELLWHSLWTPKKNDTGVGMGACWDDNFAQDELAQMTCRGSKLQVKTKFHRFTRFRSETTYSHPCLHLWRKQKNCQVFKAQENFSAAMLDFLATTTGDGE